MVKETFSAMWRTRPVEPSQESTRSASWRYRADIGEI